MILRSSPLGGALLAGSLLLSLGPGCGQKQQPANPQTQESPTMPAPAMASPTATLSPTTTPSTTATVSLAATASPTPPASPTPTPLAGTYALNDPGATERIKTAIEFSVKGMSIGEGDARKALEDANLPPPEQITIWYTPTEVTITSNVTGSLKTPANGKPIEWTWKGDKYDVSTKWENDTLVRTFLRAGRMRVNTYSLEEGGKTVSLHVQATGKGLILGVPITSLKHPLDYVLHYKRISK